MDPAGNKGSELERRISTRNSVRISINGVDDDFDVAGMVSDGFRPPQSGSGVEPQTPSASSASPPAVAGGDPGQSPANLSPPRPSSASKPHRPHESLSLRHDGGMGSIEESSSSLTRTSSLSTESHAFVPGPESPYQGPSGPSHPYGMYTQNVRAARTMSMTTSSTEPISESSYNGLRAPAHPYTLYTQDTITEAGNVPPAPIPLGFHGLPDSYQRRIGPEGEDLADIIGPDGHTEQLPPYSRYPDEAYARKVRDVEEARPSAGGGATIVPVAASLRTSGFQTIPGAGGIGLATRNPEFESMDDLGSPQSRHSSRSFTSDGSHHEINMAAAAVSEKGQAAKPLHNWMRRRVWGIIPVWSILLTVVVLILMSVILGSVIGAFMSKQKKGPRGGYQEPSTSSTATYTFGATPIPTPTDLPPLPTGNFSMPLMTSRVLSACFADTTLAQAWQCHLVISGLRLSIAKTKEDSLGDYTAAITCDTSHTVANSVYSYGEQPFLIEKPAALELVNDTLDTGRGPAWFKMISYNKTVIVPEGLLTPDGPKHRLRSAGKYPMGSGDFKRKGIISEGAKPWICNWPESYLEIFIYAQQNSSIGAITMKPLPLPSQSPTASLPSSTVPSGRTEGSVAKTNAPGWQNGYQDGPKPTDKPVDKPTGTTPGAETTTFTTTDSTSTGVFGPIDANDNFTPPPPAYPRVIKIEERHMHGRQRPTCTKVEIQDMGEPAKPVKGPDGKPIIVEIEETAPRDHDMGDLSRRSSPLSERDGPGSPSQCGCVWFLT